MNWASNLNHTIRCHDSDPTFDSDFSKICSSKWSMQHIFFMWCKTICKKWEKYFWRKNCEKVLKNHQIDGNIFVPKYYVNRLSCECENPNSKSFRALSNIGSSKFLSSATYLIAVTADSWMSIGWGDSIVG